MNRYVLLEKLLTLALTALLVLGLPWEWVLWSYVVLGHGHFLIAYLYQYKAGKMTRAYLSSYLGWFALLTCWYLMEPNFEVLVTVTTLCFLFHMSLDELYLSRLPLDLGRCPLHLGRALEFLPALLIYAGYSLESTWASTPLFWNYKPTMVTFFTVALWILVPYVWLVWSKRHKPDGKSFYFFFWAACLMALRPTERFQDLGPVRIFGFIIIYHYLSWYIHYFLSLKESGQKRTYLARVFLCNGIVLALYSIQSGTFLERWYFGLEAYYLWALLHIISSTRSKDVKAVFTPRPPRF